MGEDSKISWTHHTFNPWWGCARVSPGCQHCYAEQLATVRRKLDVWGVDVERKPMSEAYWREPLKWDRAAAAAGERHRVFCASMADVFEVPPERNTQARAVLHEGRARLWNLIKSTPHLDWLLLTKRPENMVTLAPQSWAMAWPRNVWAGTTVEDQARATKRIPHLLDVPARVRFLSCEPLLEAVRLTEVCGTPRTRRNDSLAARGLQWVIVGGESGPKARPFDLAWARQIVWDCAIAHVPCFVKQLGTDPIDGLAGCEVHLRDPKGGDMNEWPEDLRVRQFPELP